MNFTQIFKTLKSHIHEIEKRGLGVSMIDKYDWSGKDNYIIIKNVGYNYKNIKIIISYIKNYCNGKVEVERNTRLFYNDKEIELNKTTANKLINLLR